MNARRAATVGFVTLLVATALAAGGPAAAENFPEKRITLINPFAAGGSLDVLCRLLAERLRETLGQPVVVEVRSGAGSTIGSNFVAKSKPDGHTLLAQATNFTIAPAVGAKLPYDWKKDFAPVTLLGTIPQVLTVPQNSPVQTVNDLVKAARAQPGSVTYGTLGDGSGGHLHGSKFQRVAGIQLTQIPFKGNADILTALAGGHISMSFSNLPEVIAYQRQLRVRPLAIATEARSEMVPDLPTMAEAGYPGVISVPWYGILAPAGTPRPVIGLLQKEFAAALKHPATVARLKEMGITGIGSTPEEFAERLDSEVKRFRTIAEETGIRLN
jgi:tripartite-type tricarboxylate transporter receptor subunit TctC